MLALTGPTGVGKSETAFRIAEGALAKRRRVGKSFKYLPDGLLTLRGEDYARGDIEEVMCTHDDSMFIIDVLLFEQYVRACLRSALNHQCTCIY